MRNIDLIRKFLINVDHIDAHTRYGYFIVYGEYKELLEKDKELFENVAYYPDCSEKIKNGIYLPLTPNIDSIAKKLGLNYKTEHNEFYGTDYMGFSYYKKDTNKSNTEENNLNKIKKDMDDIKESESQKLSRNLLNLGFSDRFIEKLVSFYKIEEANKLILSKEIVAYCLKQDLAKAINKIRKDKRLTLLDVDLLEEKTNYNGEFGTVYFYKLKIYCRLDLKKEKEIDLYNKTYPLELKAFPTSYQSCDGCGECSRDIDEIFCFPINCFS